MKSEDLIESIRHRLLNLTILRTLTLLLSWLLPCMDVPVVKPLHP
jgi:hypothetical protein